MRAAHPVSAHCRDLQPIPASSRPAVQVCFMDQCAELLASRSRIGNISHPSTQRRRGTWSQLWTWAGASRTRTASLSRMLRIMSAHGKAGRGQRAGTGRALVSAVAQNSLGSALLSTQSASKAVRHRIRAACTGSAWTRPPGAGLCPSSQSRPWPQP